MTLNAADNEIETTAKNLLDDAEETSRRYREDPAFKAAVRAELRAKTVARRERARERIAKRNKENSNNRTKETKRG